MNKQNNVKALIKKIAIGLIALTLVIFLFTVFNEYQLNKNNTGHKKGDKYLLVKYTLANKDILPEDADVGQMWEKYRESLFIIVQDYVKLTKEGDYYIADFNYVNKKALGKVTHVDFALNNNNGVTVKDAVFDKDKLIAKLPVGYYEKLKDQSDTVLQAQILSLTTKENIDNVKIPYVKYNLLGNTKKELNEEIYNMSTTIPTVGMSKSKWYNKEDIEVYVNGDKYVTNKNNSKYYDDTGVIEIGRNPFLINKIEIKTNKKNIFTKLADKLLGISRVNADYRYFDDMAAVGTMESFDHYEMQEGYTYYFGGEYGTGSGTVIELQGNSSGVVTPDNVTVPSSYGFSDDSIWYITHGYSNSYNSTLYGTDGTADDETAAPDRTWNAVMTGNAPGSAITDGWVVVCETNSDGTCVSSPNATRALKLPKKVWYYYKNEDGSTNWDSADEYNFNLYSAFSDYDGWVALFCGHSTVATSTTTEDDWQNWIGLTLLKVDTDKKYVVVAISTYYEFGNQTGYGIYKFWYEEPDNYCLKVKKQDAENNAALDNATFQLSDGQTCTTSGGTCTFKDLASADYTITEVGSPEGYCNDEPTTVTVSSSQLTQMNGDECPSDAVEIPKSDHKIYYCAKVKKIDSKTKDLIKDASFKTTINGNEIEHADNWDGASDGYTSFFTSSTSSQLAVEETVSPAGYAKYNGTLNATPVPLRCGLSEVEAENECKNITCTYDKNTNTDSCKYADGTAIPELNIDTMPTYPEDKLMLNWYKVTEDGSTRANGAKFKVKQKNGNQYIKINGTQEVEDASGTKKTCYIFDGLVSSQDASEFESMNTNTNGSTSNGEVCIVKISKGDYTVTETNPAKYHTFGESITKDISTGTSYKAMDNSNKFINMPTRFEFDKGVTSGDSDIWKTITTQQLKKIPFNIFDSDGNKLSFVLKNGTYQYTGNNIDGPGTSGATQDLYLNDVRKFIVEHLPEGTYSVKEKGSTDGTCTCPEDTGCIGFYYPKYSNESDYKFTITKCSNESANSSACSTHKTVTKSLNNVPTEIQFTKADLYSYEDASDIVDFENDKERNDFDRIVFKLKDSSGKYMKLIKVGNHGTCLTDDSYAEYRYVPEEFIQYLSAAEKAKLTEELHTCGGHIRITHLCRNKKYYIEEVSVPEDSVFTLPENPADRTREYNIPCCGDKTTPSTSKTVIVDKGTRVRFEKRDSKYNYLIPDETTTFQVYQCKKGTECNPADSNENVRKLMKFAPRAVITGDQEDPKDAEGLAGVEVYNAMSDSDVKAGKTNVTDLHPYKGILVLRYLPSGYNYVLLETVAPKNYTLPKGRDAQTRFTVVNNTVNVDEVDMPNVPTSLLIRKYSDDGKLLKGAQFKIYEGTTCDANLSAMNQPKKELKLKTIRDGVYESRPITDTNIIQTCDDDNGVCSSIPLDAVTKLTYTDYLGTWADFDNVVNDNNEKIELAEGEALVQYLEYNHCYIIEEIKAPKGYSLPKKAEDRFTMVTIEENEQYAKDTYKTLINTPTPFTFYKYDEYNNLIDGAEFKLQKLDDNKKYQDLTVTQEEKNGELYYKVDLDTDNKTIITKNGKATVYYLEEGQYRILETKAAPGKELGKNANVATFFVDDSGNVYGNAIISNKPKTETIEVKSSSSAEFIIGPRTGVTVIKYGLIIAILVAAITGLMIFQRKKK